MTIRNWLVEFEDCSWFPNTIRESMTDFLSYIVTMLNFYKPVTPFLVEGLAHSGTNQIIDLCSGGGGAIEQIAHNIRQQSALQPNIVLTDKFPNKNAFELLHRKTNGTISYADESIDAANVPAHLGGFRTIFSAFHHFQESSAKAILQNAVDAQAGIGIFDGGDRTVFAAFVGILLLQPMVFFFCTPFFKPFRLSRLIFTYLIPLIPLCTMWDGTVSVMRLYEPAQLLKLAAEVEAEHYVWQAGKVQSRCGFHVTYLLGYPKT